MNNLHCLGVKLGHLCCCSCMRVACLGKSLGCGITSLYRYLLFSLTPFWFQFCYLMCVSIMGFLFLTVLKPRSGRPVDLDTLFMSVSATTVSSMSTVEMEVYSNAQLVVFTILMLFGGEVFTSVFELQIEKSKLFAKKHKQEQNSNVVVNYDDQMELGDLSLSYGSFESNKSVRDVRVGINDIESIGGSNTYPDLRYNSMRYLGNVILGYVLVVLVGGSILVFIYMNFVSSAMEVLKSKGLHTITFSVFTVISTFANCGFIPTNENLIVFRKNTGLLILLIPQILFGNTLFPACLRSVLGVLGRFSKRPELSYILKQKTNNNTTTDDNQIGRPASEFLISTKHCLFLVATVLGFILVQFILYCSMEWNSEGFDGMNSFEKLFGALFQTINSRHSGENIIDLATVSPAVLVLFVVMMYLPPYTSFVPLINIDEQFVGNCDQRKKRRRQLDNLLFSQLSYVAISIILICITERKKIKEDPINFSVLNITIEVISAYGNVGFTTGYSCKRQLNPDAQCTDKWYGFVGRWSNKGKLILILVMFFGKLKKFSLKGGKAWKLSTKDSDIVK